MEKQRGMKRGKKRGKSFPENWEIPPTQVWNLWYNRLVWRRFEWNGGTLRFPKTRRDLRASENGTWFPQRTAWMVSKTAWVPPQNTAGVVSLAKHSGTWVFSYNTEGPACLPEVRRDLRVSPTHGGTREPPPQKNAERKKNGKEPEKDRVSFRFYRNWKETDCDEVRDGTARWLRG